MLNLCFTVVWTFDLTVSICASCFILYLIVVVLRVCAQERIQWSSFGLIWLTMKLFICRCNTGAHLKVYFLSTLFKIQLFCKTVNTEHFKLSHLSHALVNSVTQRALYGCSPSPETKSSHYCFLFPFHSQTTSPSPWRRRARTSISKCSWRKTFTASDSASSTLWKSLLNTTKKPPSSPVSRETNCTWSRPWQLPDPPL